MVMISACGGCDSAVLAHLLALFEAISGVVTIIKSAWWYYVFRISPLDGDLENPNANGDIAGPYRPDADNESNLSNASLIEEARGNNILWTITGMMMGTINIALAAFLFVGLTTVNYVFLVGWCLSFPIYYLIDCILFTILLKHCTNKTRFDRLRSHYIFNTIMGFIFNSYLLWVGISVIHWCNCRRNPNQCSFSRDYCHSFHLNFSITTTSDSLRLSNNNNDVYHTYETVSF